MRDLRLQQLLLDVRARLHGVDRERGDVPGWVMITIMTAGIVVVLWGVAQPALSDLLSNALDSVTGPQ